MNLQRIEIYLRGRKMRAVEESSRTLALILLAVVIIINVFCRSRLQGT